VETVNPLITIKPFDPKQVVGLVPIAEVRTGRVFTTTFTVPGSDGQLATVATTLYVSEYETKEFNLIGFCKAELNPVADH